MSTLSTLNATRLAQPRALEGRLFRNPIRAAALETARRRNAALDGLFYDVGAVEEEEARRLAPWIAHEGAIVVTPPRGGPPLSVHADLEAFVAAGEMSRVRILAVAGVGSSALGAAALARNVADAEGEPVAAVVSGYGFADVLTEALGGWFCFGALNSMRHAFERFDRASRLFERGPRSAEALDLAGFARMSHDTSTLTRLLCDPRFSPRLLVGHSKGNLVISEALYWLKAQDPDRCRDLGRAAAVVTLCAKICMPEEFDRVVDITGEYDLFGAMNSRLDIPSDHIVPGAWHSTNPAFPFGLGLDVAKALKAARPLLDAPRVNWEPGRGPIGPSPAQAATALLPN